MYSGKCLKLDTLLFTNMIDEVIDISAIVSSPIQVPS